MPPKVKRSKSKTSNSDQGEPSLEPWEGRAASGPPWGPRMCGPAGRRMRHPEDPLDPRAGQPNTGPRIRPGQPDRSGVLAGNRAPSGHRPFGRLRWRASSSTWSRRLSRPITAQRTRSRRPAAEDIAVENPATGEIVATVPDLGAEVSRRWPRAPARRSRSGRRPASRRARILLRAQKWLMDNSEQVIATIISRPARPSRTPRSRRSPTRATRSASGPRTRRVPRRQRVKSGQLLVKGKKLILRHRPLGLIGVIGPWNYPLTNSFGDCIPALTAGNSVILKPSEVPPLTSLLMAEGLRECGCRRTYCRSRPAAARPARR